MHTQETEVLTAADMTWELMPNHIELYHREIVSAAQADRLGIRMSSILWEKLGVGGQVLPHHHDVVEIIHITVGRSSCYARVNGTATGPGIPSMYLQV